MAHRRLGLSVEEYEKLAQQVDAIYHNGAVVDFIQPYSALKEPNVIGTQEVLRLACSRKLKAVHYISTLSVFGEEKPPHSEGFNETDCPYSNIGFANGYAQSKWVAEQLVRIAGERGIPVSIYRPSTIVGHSKTGVWNTGDFLCRMIQGCLQIGEVPEEENTFDLVPVDYVSRAVVYLASLPDSPGQVFHLNNLCSPPIKTWRERLRR